MKATKQGEVPTTPRDMAAMNGIDYDSALTPEQIKMAERYELDVEKVKGSYALKDFDNLRISKGEIEARSEKGENLIEVNTSNLPDLTEEQMHACTKLGANIDLARRTRVQDDQTFISKSERDAQESKAESGIFYA